MGSGYMGIFGLRRTGASAILWFGSGEKVADSEEMEFPFERLKVYQQAQEFNLRVQGIVRGDRSFHPSIDQISRAALSVPLNIAEAQSRWNGPDRRRMLRIALGSNFECVPLIDVLHKNGLIDAEERARSREQLAAVGKMLTALINLT